jgi:hypothetical protein
MEGEKMPAPKGNRFAKGNKGGRPSKYKPEYAETAQKLCARLGFTDEQLADWFEVEVRTIHRWRAEIDEFCQACRVGKSETDNLVERAAVQHMTGYYVTVEELDKFGVVRKLRKWIPGNAHAAMKWLSARRPQVYRDQLNVKHTLSPDDAFLRFLDLMEAEHLARVIEHMPVADSPSAHNRLKHVENAQVLEVEESRAQKSTHMGEGSMQASRIRVGH